MLFRSVVLFALVAAIPCRALAAHYTVHPGDSLSLIAQRYHISVSALARANRIFNVNLVQVGRVLWVPGSARYPSGGARHYRVRWGDSLSLIAVRFHTTVGTLRALNPRLGRYLLTGQVIVVGRTGRGHGGGTATRRTYSSGTRHTVRPGDTLSGIAVTYGVSTSALMTANGITNPNQIVIGASLVVPAGGYARGGSTASYSGYTSVYDPYTARALIVQYAQYYGLETSFPLAVGWLESGFNQTVVSYTGAIGVMQVEPYTARHISRLLGRRLNVHLLDDNIRAGVFWLAALVRYYGGNERLAAAAYYQGARALALRGMYTDTKQYVANVMALKIRFGG